MLTDFQKFCNVGKRMKFATKFIRHYPHHLRHVATLPWEIKNSNFLQIFCRHGRKCKQIAFLVASLQVIPILIANKTFLFTVVLFIYFCDQFMAPEIRHDRRHCRVCRQSTWYETILIKLLFEISMRKDSLF